jgi:ADP-ribose pyrophosphatase YjhB (NUDIX family)
MANQQLYDKQYSVPSDVIKYIQTVLVSSPSGEGVKRAKFIVKNGSVTYQELKRLKNFFDNFNTQANNKAQYALAGGNLMKAFVDATLNQQRAGVQRSKEVRQDMTTNPNSELHAYQTPRLNEFETNINNLARAIDTEILRKILKEEKDKEEKQKNAVAVIVDKDNKILLLKRGKDPEIWMPGKWALVGGAIEKGESPQKAVEREILEETGLEIDKFVKTFSIQRNPNSIEHIFACRYNGDPTEITLNGENTNYGWYSVDEMKYLDIVPNLIEYITLAFKKYD